MCTLRLLPFSIMMFIQHSWVAPPLHGPAACQRIYLVALAQSLLQLVFVHAVFGTWYTSHVQRNSMLLVQVSSNMSSCNVHVVLSSMLLLVPTCPLSVSASGHIYLHSTMDILRVSVDIA